MITPKYQIGDKVWWATHDTEEKHTTCEDCLGSKYVKVIMGGGTEHSIQCENCKRGWLGPVGYTVHHEGVYAVKERIIKGISIQDSVIEYQLYLTSNSWNNAQESQLFTDKGQAEEHAKQLTIELNERNEKNKYKKTKEHKNWAYHVSYHRNCYKKAMKDAEYHQSMLNYAKTKTKETDL